MRRRAGGPSSAVPLKRVRRRRVVKRFLCAAVLLSAVLLLLWQGAMLSAHEDALAPAASPEGGSPAKGRRADTTTSTSSTTTIMSREAASHSRGMSATPGSQANSAAPTLTELPSFDPQGRLLQAIPTLPLPASGRTGPYQEVDALDVFPPRPFENFISFEAYLACLAARLHLDLTAKRELPFPTPAPTETTAGSAGSTARATASSPQAIPYLVQPVSFELSDIKQFMCSLDIPLHHITYVMNGRAPEVRLFLEALGAVVEGWTSRVQIHFFPDVLGSAASINVGLRHAISDFTYEEVPFIFVSEPTVRVHPSTMAALVSDIYDYTTYDLERITALEKEVAAEAKANAQRARPRLVRTGPEGAVIANGRGVLSTSALLPQRIRDLPVEAQMEMFTEHTALFYFNVDDGPGRHTSFFVSRLAVLVGGYLDENYFPDYFDDPDIRWRYRQLGFTSVRAAYDKPAAVFHDDMILVFPGEENENDGADDDDSKGEQGHGKDGAKPKPTLSPQAKEYCQQMRDGFGDGYSFTYAAWKWRENSPVRFQEEFGPFPIYDYINRGRKNESLKIPVDAWVLDRRRLSSIRRKLRGIRLNNPGEVLYDVSLLEGTDFLQP